MKRFKNAFLLISVIVLQSTMSISAQNILVDNFSDGDGTNELDQGWYYYDDNAGVTNDDRPQAAPESDPSVIDVSYTLKPREAFGDPTDTYQIKDYSFTTAIEGTDTFARMPFTYGESWEVSYGTAQPYVGMGTLLAAPGSYIDLSSATAISFKMRSHKIGLNIFIRVQTDDIQQDSSFAYYQDTATAVNSWAVKTVNLANLKQPDWTPSEFKRPFDPTKVTCISWEIQKSNNSGTTSDTLDIDSIVIINPPATPPLMLDNFEDGDGATDIGTYWYFYDDADHGGTSKVQNAGSDNSFTGSYTPGSGSAYSGVLDFTLGGTGSETSHVGYGLGLTNDRSPVDLTGAKAVQFDIKASRTMNIMFFVGQPTIPNSTGDHYHKDISVGTSWTTVTVNLATGDGNLAQEGWGDEVPFTLDAITKIEWIYFADKNSGSLLPGTLLVDNIRFLGTPAGLMQPYPPLTIAPAWKSIDNPVSPEFSWHSRPSAASYSLQISKMEDFSSLVANKSGLTDTACSVGPLDYGTTYYWRVNVVVGTVTSKWSAVNKFTTLYNTPAAPISIYPADSVNDTLPTSLSFIWHSSTGAKSYSLQVSTSPDFASTIVNNTGYTDTSFAISTLANATKYYWRVSATNLSGTSPWSLTLSFKTWQAIPDVPVLLAPENSSTGRALNEQLSWNAAARASTYDLQVSTTSAFTSFIINQYSITATTFSDASLANSTTYYWRVRSFNSGGASEWSEVRTFTTIAATPAVPVLVYPEANMINVSVDNAVRWSGSGTCRVMIATDSMFTSIQKDSSGITSDSLHWSLSNNTKYFWRVCAVNGGVTSEWSAIRSFTTIPLKPAVPILTYPPQDTTKIPTTWVLFWNSGYSSCRVIMSTDSMFTTTCKDSAAITTDTFNFSLSNNTKYYWKVCATNAGGTSEWSEVRRFTTIVALPSAVIPVSIDTVKATDVILSWQNATPEVKQYWVEISTDSAMTSAIIDTGSDTSSLFDSLSDNTRYWWRVRAANDAGWGEYSAKMSFYVLLPVSVVTPKEFRAFTFGAGSMNRGIRYTLPEKCHVKFSIYNLKGSLVQTVVDAQQGTGVYTLTLPHLSSGAYYMTLTAGTYRFNSKVILTR